MQNFSNLHKEQLRNIPNQYHESLYKKISNDIFDASDFNLTSEKLYAARNINDIYLIDHAWTVKGFDQVERDVKSIPALSKRFSFDLEEINVEMIKIVKIVMAATGVEEGIAIKALRDADWQTLDAIQV